MRIEFHGRLADAIAREVELELTEPCTIADLRLKLEHRYPQAREELARRTVRACVGDAIVPDSSTVEPVETVEFLPPLSGG